MNSHEGEAVRAADRARASGSSDELFALDDTQSEHRMDREECLRLLRIDDLGRLAIIQGGAPSIFPVNYAMDGESIVFRTAPGTKLMHGSGSLAAFEIDFVSPEDREGWSVVATGRLEEVGDLDADLSERVRHLGVRPLASGVKDHWMRLVPGLISGRRVGTRITG